MSQTFSVRHGLTLIIVTHGGRSHVLTLMIPYILTYIADLHVHRIYGYVYLRGFSPHQL